MVWSAPLSVVCNEGVINVATPAIGIVRVIGAIAGIVAEQIIVNAITILFEAVSTDVTAVAAATVLGLCSSLRGAGAGDYDHERWNSQKGDFSCVPSLEITLLRLGIGVEHSMKQHASNG
jgi:hypothetical protein